MILTPWPKAAFLGNNGRPLVGGQLFTYEAGTSTKIATYTDEGGMSQNTNPVVLDFRGEANVWLDPELTYKFVLSPRDDTDPPTNPIWTVDNISALGGLTPEIIGKLLWPITDAEIATGFTEGMLDFVGPQGYASRYRITPNDQAFATGNTTALRTLLDNTKTGPTGRVWFENFTGADVYYFDNIVAIRDGIQMDLGGCTLHFHKTAEATDTGSGFLWPIRDFVIENGFLDIDYDMNGVSSSAGYALKFGGRGDDNTTYWPALWDSLLSAPMGKIIVRNIQITSNVQDASGGCIAATGGLKEVTIDHVIGSGAYNGFVYEFGWATSGTTNLRETSHMSEFTMSDCRWEDCDTSAGIGIIIGGAYNYTIKDVTISEASAVFSCTPGESLFYRPWAGVDDNVKKGLQSLKNINGLGITSSSSLAGAQSAAGGYLSAIIAALSPTAAQYIAQTDLATYNVDGLVIEGGGGLLVSGPCTLSNVTIKGGTIALTDECVDFTLTNVSAYDSASIGLRLSIGAAIWSPVRLKIGSVEGGVFAGNLQGMSVNFGRLIHVRNVRFGYSSVYDATADETVQTNCILVDATNGGGGVIADGCFMTPKSGSNAYAITGTPVNTCDIHHPRGDVSISGPWSINGMASANGTALADKTSNINVAGKYLRKQCLNSSTNKVFLAQGSTDVSTWISVDAATTITPV